MLLTTQTLQLTAQNTSDGGVKLTTQNMRKAVTMLTTHKHTVYVCHSARFLTAQNMIHDCIVSPAGSQPGIAWTDR